MWYRRAVLAVLFLAVRPNLYAEQTYNLSLIKRDTQILERVVHEVLKQNFTSPFAITAEPRAAYLQGYGVVMSFQLNVNRGTIRTPFGQMKAPKSHGQKTKEQQVKIVRDSMIQCLADFGNSVKQLGPHDKITIQAHIADRNELDPAKSMTVMVLTVLKDDLNMLSTRQLSPEKFKERVHVVEY